MVDLAEVRSGLMQLDRRLDELARGLVHKPDTDVGEDADAVERDSEVSTAADVPASIPLVSSRPASAPRAPAAPATSVPTVASVSEAPVACSPAPSVQNNGGPNPATVQRATSPGPSSQRTEAAVVTLARAEEEAARILARVHERADQVKTEIRELLAVRDRLRVTTQEILATYGQALSALEIPSDDAIAALDGDDGSQGEASETAAIHDHRLFSGDVSVIAGPVRDLGAIRMLEDALVGIEAVESVSLTGFTDHNVQIELRLETECGLVSEFARALPFAFEIESVSDADLALRLSAG